MAVWIVKIVAVIAIIGVAAALATPKGRLPIAMRAVRRMILRDRGLAVGPEEAIVPGWKRLVAFVLVVVAAVICMV